MLALALIVITGNYNKPINGRSYEALYTDPE